MSDEFERYQMFQQFQVILMMSSSNVTLAQTSNFTVYFMYTAPNIWIINSGASNHMTENKGILFPLNSIFSLLLVTLAYGSTSYTESMGTVNATPSLSLSYVLYIPKFLFNLLFGSRLTKSLNCSITLFPDHCVFQGHRMQKTIGTGHESEDIYYLERGSEVVACSNSIPT